MKHEYTDTKLQAAIDEACDKLAQSTRVYLNALDLDNTTESWPVEAPARLDLIKSALAALPEPMDEESMLLNLLAVIHRDGGHYQAEHGTRKAVADACKEWQRLISIVEKTGLTEPKQALSQLRPLSEAGPVPEGCVRHYTYKQDGEWTTATKHRAMQDTHYIDTRLSEPSEKPDPYAELKAAHAAGKMIQINCCTVEHPNWIDLPSPAFFGKPHEYRIKPETETFEPTPEPMLTKPISLPLAESMSLRDWFAGQALAGLLAQPAEPEFGTRYFAECAYILADAMIAAREVKP
jgi:hypothetical protein